ncbi:hypothetical protein HOD08_03690 [bacterium]|nr:hypothetical protein [bacterium]
MKRFFFLALMLISSCLNSNPPELKMFDIHAEYCWHLQGHLEDLRLRLEWMCNKIGQQKLKAHYEEATQIFKKETEKGSHGIRSFGEYAGKIRELENFLAKHENVERHALIIFIPAYFVQEEAPEIMKMIPYIPFTDESIVSAPQFRELVKFSQHLRRIALLLKNQIELSQHRTSSDNEKLLDELIEASYECDKECARAIKKMDTTCDLATCIIADAVGEFNKMIPLAQQVQEEFCNQPNSFPTPPMMWLKKLRLRTIEKIERPKIKMINLIERLGSKEERAKSSHSSKIPRPNFEGDTFAAKKQRINPAGEEQSSTQQISPAQSACNAEKNKIDGFANLMDMFLRMHYDGTFGKPMHFPNPAFSISCDQRPPSYTQFRAALQKIFDAESYDEAKKSFPLARKMFLENTVAPALFADITLQDIVDLNNIQPNTFPRTTKDAQILLCQICADLSLYLLFTTSQINKHSREMINAFVFLSNSFCKRWNRIQYPRSEFITLMRLAKAILWAAGGISDPIVVKIIEGSSSLTYAQIMAKTIIDDECPVANLNNPVDFYNNTSVHTCKMSRSLPDMEIFFSDHPTRVKELLYNFCQISQKKSQEYFVRIGYICKENKIFSLSTILGERRVYNSTIAIGQAALMFMKYLELPLSLAASQLYPAAPIPSNFFGKAKSPVTGNQSSSSST